MKTLEEKQLYFNYGPSGWTYKQPPALDPSLREELTRLGSDRFGDPLYRFNWGGVAVVRDEEDGVPTVRGDRAATKLNMGRLMPRYLFARAKQPVRLYYLNKREKKVFVKRQEDVPKDRVAVWDVGYVDYGQLRWFLERKLTPEQLVEAGFYLRDDPDVPPQGDYVCLLKVETPDGLYFEPTHEFLDAIREHLWEANNVSLSDLVKKDRAARQRARDVRDAVEEASRTRAVELLMSQHTGRSVAELFQR